MIVILNVDEVFVFFFWIKCFVFFLDVVFDIIIVGKFLGNGYLMVLVVIIKEIADSIGEFNSIVSGIYRKDFGMFYYKLDNNFIDIMIEWI